MDAGKFRGFKRISNSRGQFIMLALDQRGALKRMISKIRSVKDPDDLLRVKIAILKSLADKVSAVLIDPEYGFPENLRFVPKETGVIVATEKTGYLQDGDKGGRLTELVSIDIIERIKLSGADAAKLLIYWSENASQRVKIYQEEIVKCFGESCRKLELLSILEIVTYDTTPQGRDYHVLSALELFSQSKFAVDLFKIEPFSPSISKVSMNEIETAVRGKPWVVLSGGMDVLSFVETVDFNCRLGSSGFLAGRVVWKDAVTLIESPERMEEFLRNSGSFFLNSIKRACRSAVPFYATSSIGGHESILIE